MAFDDRQLDDWYRQFSSDHERLKGELLESLAAPDANSESLSTIEMVGNISIFRKRLVWVTAAAALLLVAIGLLSVISRAEARSFTIYDLREVFQKVRSIHLRGWHYHRLDSEKDQPAKRYPLELYFERPGRYWHTTYGFSPDSVNDGYRTSSDGRYGIVMNSAKVAVSGQDQPLDAELYVEGFLQDILGFLTAGEMGARRDRYELVENEQIGDLSCDVYEQVVDDLTETVWIDPLTGHPTRVQVTQRRADGASEMLLEYDSIVVDGLPPGDKLDQPMPEELQLHKADKQLTQVGMLFAQNGLTLRYVLNIDDRAVLCCWSSPLVNTPQMTAEEVAGIVASVEFVLGDTKQECEHKVLQIDYDGNHNWVWSLMTPIDRSVVVTDSTQVSLSVLGEHSQMTQARKPLVLDELRLAALIQELAATTSGNPENGKALTLNALRLIIRAQAQSTTNR